MRLILTRNVTDRTFNCAHRRREPALHRPFRVPGGMAGVIALAVGPTLLIAYAMYAARDEQVLGMRALLFAAIVGAAGVLIYAIANFFQKRTASAG